MSVLMHVLLCINSFTIKDYQSVLETTLFTDKIRKFIETFSKMNTINNEAMEIDKKTVLDLCAHMFHQLEDD